MKLSLPAALHAAMVQAAITAYPRECCGLIEGVKEGDAFEAIALHPGRNLAASADRFEIDPAEHIAAMKAARAKGRAVIGCYHSHPDGKAQPSAHDLGGAGAENFLWAIAATDGSECRIAAFVYRGAAFSDVTLVSAPAPIG